MAMILKQSLLKKLTEEPVVPKTLIGEPMDDPIIKFASQIEKVKTRTEIEETIKKHSNARQFELFKLGGAIAVAHALFEKSKSEFEDCKNFREYVEMVLGIDYSTAMRAAGIYRKLVHLGIPWSAFENLEWTKVLVLLDIVTKDNVKPLVAKAKR
jgi:hypothetical protein